MEESSKKLWEILVPKYMPNGAEIDVWYHKEFDKSVIDISGGLTVFRSGVGYWSGVEGFLRERMIPARIYCTEAEISKIANIAKKHYAQQEVMYYLVSEKVYFV